jgi:hypothetical protein
MRRPVFAILLLMAPLGAAVAQRSRPAKDTDPKIAAVLKEVSADQIRRNI